MTVRELYALLACYPGDAEVVIVLDAKDVDPTDLELGTTPEGNTCVYIMTTDLKIGAE